MTAETKAETCEICGREVWLGWNDPAERCMSHRWPDAPKVRMECYRIGYERERAARVKAEDRLKRHEAYFREWVSKAADVNQAMHAALYSKIGVQRADLVVSTLDLDGRAAAMQDEISALRAECATLRAALNWCIGHFQGAHPNEPVPAHLLAAEKARKP